MQSSQQQSQGLINKVPSFKLHRFNKHPAAYTWIFKSKRIGNTIYGNRVGAVAAYVVKDELRIGWSLCNVTTKVKERPILINQYEVMDEDGQILSEKTIIRGDRFNQDHAREISLGRAIAGHKHNRVYTVKGDITKERLIQDGIPQSAINTICQVVQEFVTGSEIKYVSIYCDKPMVSHKGTPAW